MEDPPAQLIAAVSREIVEIMDIALVITIIITNHIFTTVIVEGLLITIETL